MTGTRTKELTLIMWNRIKELYNNKEYKKRIIISKANVLADMIADKTVEPCELLFMGFDCFLCAYFFISDKGYCNCNSCPLQSCYDGFVYNKIVYNVNVNGNRERLLQYIDELIKIVSDWAPID